MKIVSKQFYTISEIAKLSGIKPDTARNIIFHRRTLKDWPYITAGKKKRLYPANHIDEIIKVLKEAEQNPGKRGKNPPDPTMFSYSCCREILKFSPDKMKYRIENRNLESYFIRTGKKARFVPIDKLLEFLTKAM